MSQTQVDEVLIKESKQDLDSIDNESIMTVMEEIKERPLVIRFPSRYGDHFVKYTDNRGFVAVFAGPHGPENRPADIDYENISRLFQQSSGVSVIHVSESPYSCVEVEGLRG